MSRFLAKGILFICIGLSFSVVCQTAPTEVLVNYVYLGEFSKNAAQNVLLKTPPLDSLAVNYPLNLYKITYKTPAPDGHITIASGLVAMPQSPLGKVGIVSYQHGTRVSRSDVPSSNNEKNDIFLATFGSHGGYMMVMPDYLGMGDNELDVHPYVQADTLASSTSDMLIAAKDFAKAIDYPVNNKVFLAGYSEGGFSTLVTFELLAKKKQNVTAVALGSAPYDWQETIPFIMQDPGPRATLYLAYFFFSMQTYQHYWEDLNDIFISPYNLLIPIVLDGYHSLPEILQTLPMQPRDILQPAFFDAIINETDKNSDNLKRNFNHYDFTPNAPLLLVGTRGDKDVPYHGAEIAFAVFKQHSNDVYIKSVSDTLDHLQAVPLILKEQLDFFKKYDH